MKILVLSDSHSALRFMEECVEAVKPDALIHLGDYFDDAQALHETHPHLPLYQVPGNCDRYRCPPDTPEILMEQLAGVRVYMTHGHRHNVKYDTAWLLSAARQAGAQVVLYGHTHEADCRRESDGLWVLNPGSCGYYGGSAGLLVMEAGTIQCCRILRQEDLEEFA